MGSYSAILKPGDRPFLSSRIRKATVPALFSMIRAARSAFFIGTGESDAPNVTFYDKDNARRMVLATEINNNNSLEVHSKDGTRRLFLGTTQNNIPVLQLYFTSGKALKTVGP
jgi:hypothetical protein